MLLLLLLTAGIPSWHTCDVGAFGAVGDGVTDDTRAIRAALAACHGGGSVLLRAGGTFLTGPLNLTDNIELVVERNATLLATSDTSHYPQIAPLPSYGWTRDVNCFDSARTANGTVVGVLRYAPIIGAFGASNVSVRGGGLLNGSGTPWWDRCKAHALAAGRPRLVEFNNVTRGTIEDLTLRDSPFWTIHLVYSREVTARRLAVFAPYMGLGNTDAVNPDSSRDVLIEDIYTDNSDDGVAIKSGMDEFGRKVGLPVQNVLIRNVTSAPGSRGGVAIGSEMSGGVRNITVEDSVLLGMRGLHIKSCAGRGGYIEDVTFRNVLVAGGVSLTMHYPGEEKGGPVPAVSNVHFVNISGQGGCDFQCDAVAGHRCVNLTFEAMRVSGCTPPGPA